MDFREQYTYFGHVEYEIDILSPGFRFYPGPE